MYNNIFQSSNNLKELCRPGGQECIKPIFNTALCSDVNRIPVRAFSPRPVQIVVRKVWAVDAVSHMIYRL